MVKEDFGGSLERVEVDTELKRIVWRGRLNERARNTANPSLRVIAWNM